MPLRKNTPLAEPCVVADLDGRIHVWQALRACNQPNLNYPMPEAELDGRIHVWQALRACNQPP